MGVWSWAGQVLSGEVTGVSACRWHLRPWVQLRSEEDRVLTERGPRPPKCKGGEEKEPAKETG